MHSMTGFGAGDSEQGNSHYRCEIKSLNSRYLDVSVRLPKFLNPWEAAIIKAVKAKIKRGKVEVSFDLQLEKTSSLDVAVNLNAANQYLEAHQKLASLLQDNQAPALPLYRLMKLEGVLDVQNSRPDDTLKHEKGLISATEQALASLLAARSEEGEQLKSALQKLVAEVKKSTVEIQEMSPKIREEALSQARERLVELIEKVTEDPKIAGSAATDTRLLSELAIYSDKIDIDEELTRLLAHCETFQETIHMEEAIGRKLDFICQEMHREVTTLSNKMTHISIARKSVDLKQIIERIRQQVQNIE